MEKPNGNKYICHLDTEDVIKYNTLMNGITSTRGGVMGIVQINTLVLKEDQGFELEKVLKSTKKNEMIKKPVNVRYLFSGTYQTQGDTVLLSEAQKGKGSVSWGTISDFVDTGDGEYDCEEVPGILSLYPTPYFIENCKNVPMKVHLDRQGHTFAFEEFEPVILSAEEVKLLHKERQLVPNAGLMKQSLTVESSKYSLKEAFTLQGMRVGTCINLPYLEEPYARLVKAQFNSVTLENHLKPENTLSRAKSRKTGKLSVQFSGDTKRLLDWCRENDMPLRGHTLIWYLSTPTWVFHKDFLDDAENVDREELLVRMEDYIRGFFEELEEGEWSDTLYCIDVVNEAIIAPGEMRKLPWQEIIGDDYIWHAFHFARKYAPQHIRLAYNDFDLEVKTDKVIELVNTLKDEKGGSLVDIIGQQGHYGAYSNADTLMVSLEKIGKETGCELQVTELDVSISRQGREEELKLQGRFYYNFVQQILSLKKKGINITGITLWGFTDALSWMPGGYLHLYDRNLIQKYAYFGMLGMKEYAGFDGSEEAAEEGKYIFMRFAAEEDEAKYIQLSENGTFLDTTTGMVITGKYVFDGISTYMLIPKAGGYINLTINKAGDQAERMEAAGGMMILHKQ